MASLGSDFARPGGDVTADMAFRSGDEQEQFAYLEALQERLMMPRGALFYDTDAGLDMRTYVADDEEPAVAAHEINQECLKDERTDKCTCDITVSGSSWTVAVHPFTKDGVAYELTFSVSAAQVDLLTSGPTGT